MVRPNYNLIRFIRRNIRMLKKEYGSPITIYKLNETNTNVKTGVKTVDRDSIFIRRAVVLPNYLTREQIQSISLISANKKIVQGGTFDPGRRRFIIDRSDVPNWELAHDDWIVYDGKRFNIKIIDDFEQNTAWYITASEIAGVIPEQDRYGYPNHLIEFNQTVSAVI